MDTTGELVRLLRRTGAEPSHVEVKTAVGSLPKTVPETLSAFANGEGGTLLLGLSERDGFVPAPGFDATAIRDAVADACSDKVSPPLRVPIEIVEVDGAQVVRVDIEEIDPLDKPCFVVTKGDYSGSYIRGGDGDRRLSRYEVTQLLLNRGQPLFDVETVPGATRADFDPVAVRALVTHAAARSPRTFEGIESDTALTMLRAVVDQEGDLVPTMAGLLCLGRYPQQFFPQLFVSFVMLPTPTMGETAPDGVRFLDNQTIDGTLPQVLADTVSAVRRNMSQAAIIRGIGREDRYDYPLDVVRELVANALMHRDYSPDSRGAQVQVELYPDRLVITSPGGLHGGLTTDALTNSEHVSTSRNATLAKLLADVPMPLPSTETVCENRGSGLVRVMAALRAAGMSPPEFDVTLTRLRVTVPRTALLSPETVAWVASLGLSDLSNEQHLALAMMRNAGSASNGMLQAWGVDSTTASQALRDLVQLDVAERSGGKRYARYHLVPDLPSQQQELPGLLDQVEPLPEELDPALADPLRAIRAGATSTRAIADRLGIDYQAALRRVNALIEQGFIEPTRPARSSKQTYRLTRPDRPEEQP